MKHVFLTLILAFGFMSAFAQKPGEAAMPGKAAPDFTFVDQNGKEVSLSDFKGKVVYVDFWASWCGPCKREMPFSHELRNKFKNNKDVVFLYVSVDKNEAAWRKAITDYNVTGVNLLATGGQLESMAYNYNLTGIPLFILVDKKGKIVSNPAPRPSSGQELETLITKSL